MPKEVQEKIDAEKSAKDKAERERFNKQEAGREANGDFSHAPGLTPGTTRNCCDTMGRKERGAEH
jgi:hypothetical protein